MSLTLNQSAEFKNGCKSLYINDITGDYSATGNTGGWGSPNPATGDVKLVTLTLEDKTGSMATQTATFPNWDSDYWIVPEGTAPKYDDGLYELTYDIEFTGTSGFSDVTDTVNVASLCDVTCCVNKFLTELPERICSNCDYDDYVYQAILHETLLDSLYYAYWCGKTVQFNNILETLENKCESNDCSCS